MLKKVAKLNKRRGTKSVKIIYRIHVHKITAQYSHCVAPGARLSVCFERGRKIESTGDADLQSLPNGTSEASFEQTLSVVATLYQDSSDNFLEKAGRLVVREKCSADTTYKVLGIAVLPLHTYAQLYGETNELLPLTKCVDKGVVLDVTISARQLENNGTADDCASIASDSEMGESVTYYTEGLVDDLEQEQAQRDRSLSSSSSSSSIKFQTGGREKAKPLVPAIGEEEKLTACYERENDDVRVLEEENLVLRQQLESAKSDLCSSESKCATLAAALQMEKNQVLALQARLERTQQNQREEAEEADQRQRRGCLASLCALFDSQRGGSNFVRMGSADPLPHDEEGLAPGDTEDVGMDNAVNVLLMNHTPKLSTDTSEKVLAELPSSENAIDGPADVSLDRSVDRSASGKTSAATLPASNNFAVPNSRTNGSKSCFKSGAAMQQKVKKRSPDQSKPKWLN